MDLRPTERAWLAEYEFLQAFPGTTHEQYMNTPADARDWLIHIHQLVAQQRADEQRAREAAAAR